MDTTVLHMQLGIQQVGNDALCFVFDKQEECLENSRNARRMPQAIRRG